MVSEVKCKCTKPSERAGRTGGSQVLHLPIFSDFSYFPLCTSAPLTNDTIALAISSPPPPPPQSRAFTVAPYNWLGSDAVWRRFEIAIATLVTAGSLLYLTTTGCRSFQPVYHITTAHWGNRSTSDYHQTAVFPSAEPLSASKEQPCLM
jgi:hypothetical protein